MAEWSATDATGTGAAVSEENLLIGRLKRIETNSSGYYAVHLHLSGLRASNKQPHFIQIATRTFDTVVENNDATLFPLANADLVLVCRNLPIDDVDAAVEKVRALFSEDPLAAVDETGFDDRFSTWYDLSSPEDFAAFFTISTDLSMDADRRREEERKRKDREANEGKPLGPENLSDINRKLLRARVADLVFHQTCLLVRSGGAGEVVFKEHFISMSKVRERIAPNINFFASPWLFQYLTEGLDRRLLSILAEWDFDELVEPLSMNLNISTVLSRDFHGFHRSVGDNAHKVVVEMQAIDIFADTKSYRFARDSLQERGYRVLLDGLSPISLHYFDPAILRSDLLKISWNQDLQDQDADERAAEMREIINRVGRESVVLARVDSEKALKWGVGLGVSRFQGFFIDRLAEVIGSGKRL